jgi:hypothetical protein
MQTCKHSQNAGDAADNNISEAELAFKRMEYQTFLADAEQRGYASEDLASDLSSLERAAKYTNNFAILLAMQIFLAAEQRNPYVAQLLAQKEGFFARQVIEHHRTNVVAKRYYQYQLKGNVTHALLLMDMIIERADVQLEARANAVVSGKAPAPV